MATIYNSDLSKELIEGGKIQLSRDRIPTELAEKVIPVMEVNPKLLKRVDIVKDLSSTANDTAGNVIYMVPAGMKFLLTSISFSFMKNAAATPTDYLIYANVGAPLSTTTLLRRHSITLTEDKDFIFQSYNPPIVCHPGAIQLQIVGGTAVGVAVVDVVITGYLLFNERA